MISATAHIQNRHVRFRGKNWRIFLGGNLLTVRGRFFQKMSNFQLCEYDPEYAKVRLMDVFYTKHAIQRMFERNIDEDEVTEAIENGRIISEYPDDKPYPSILINSRIPGRPLHVVYSEDGGRRIVVTVYRPALDEWNEDFSERRTSK